MVLVHDTSSHPGLQVYQVSLKNLKRFSSYRADTICDGQTDAQTDGRTDARGKTICLPTLSGGDIIRQTDKLLTYIMSLFSITVDPEQFYHEFVLGITAHSDLFISGMKLV